MFLLHITPTALTLAIGLSLVGGTAHAQDPQAPPRAPIAQQQVEVTDSLLERFVNVYPQVLEASQQAQAQLATTTDPEQAQAVRAQAEQTIMQTLAEEGMSAGEYQALVYALRDDEALRERFMAMLQEEQAQAEDSTGPPC